MKLKSLKPSILELSHDEAMKLIISIRNNRMIAKRPIKEAKKAIEKKEKKLGLDMSALDPDTLESLIKRLEERK